MSGGLPFDDKEPKQPKTLEQLLLSAKNELITQEEYKARDTLVNDISNEVNTRYLNKVLLPESEKELKEKEDKHEELKAKVIDLSGDKSKEARDEAKDLKEEIKTLEEEINKLKKDREHAVENMKKAEENAEENKRRIQFVLDELRK